MVFSSLLFLYVFFPLNILAYHLAHTPERRNNVMLAFSLVFYAWSGPAYVLLLVGMTYADFIVAQWIEKSRRKHIKKRWLFRGCAINLILLCIFKYSTFVFENLNTLCGFPFIPKIVLPIGISFYTFQLISYMVDVYRDNIPAQRKFKLLLLYVSLFHQCIAGPIVRYKTVYRELTNRRFIRLDLSSGIYRFTIGLAKKAVFANHCGELADSFLVSTDATNQLAIVSERPALSIFLGVLCYTLQIYLDFSAYSDMAIGMGRMIGFHYDENFNYPYCAASIREFWKRWHISLSTFFRDYVYIPLGGSRCKSKIRVIFNTFIVWALTGLWHGASWNFVIWGLYYFVFLMIERYILPKLRLESPVALDRACTLIIVAFGWLIFRCDDLSVLGTAIKGLLCLNKNSFTSYEVNSLFFSNILFIILAIIACTPLVKNCIANLQIKAENNAVSLKLWQIGEVAIPIVLMIISTAMLVGDSYNPFLYFRF